MYRCRHHPIQPPGDQIICRIPQRPRGQQTGGARRLSRTDMQIDAGGVGLDDADLPLARLIGVVDPPKSLRQVEGKALPVVIVDRLGAIQHRGHQAEDPAVGETAEDHLVAYAIEVPMRQSDTRGGLVERSLSPLLIFRLTHSVGISSSTPSVVGVTTRSAMVLGILCVLKSAPIGRIV